MELQHLCAWILNIMWGNPCLGFKYQPVSGSCCSFGPDLGPGLELLPQLLPFWGLGGSRWLVQWGRPHSMQPGVDCHGYSSRPNPGHGLLSLLGWGQGHCVLCPRPEPPHRPSGSNGDEQHGGGEQMAGEQGPTGRYWKGKAVSLPPPLICFPHHSSMETNLVLPSHN